MTGELVGGWSYVWAAYGVVWLGLVTYGVSLVWRSRAVAMIPAPLDDEQRSS